MHSVRTRVLKWTQSPLEWLEVRSVSEGQDDSALQHIDPGERAAILLAQEEHDILLLITMLPVAPKQTGVTIQTPEQSECSGLPRYATSWNL